MSTGLYAAVGYAPANTFLILAPEGVIVVDTSESLEAGAEIMRDFRSVHPTAPVRAVVYTHWHAQHVTGTQVGSGAATGCLFRRG